MLGTAATCLNRFGACLSCMQYARFTTAVIRNIRTPLSSTDGLIPVKTARIRPKDRMKWNPKEHQSPHPDVYDTLCVKVRGFDMVLVEKYAQTVHRLLQQNKIRIKETYALPPENNTVKYSEGGYSASVDNMTVEAKLLKYSRVVQAGGMLSTALPILLQMLVQDIPPGVELTVDKYTEEEHSKRFKVNKELATAKEDLAKLWVSR